jgi:predicted nucleotidyltransferase
MGIPKRWKRFRELPPDIDRSLGRLIPLFERRGVLLAYIFGSKGEGQTARDIDMAILTRSAPAFRLREAITEFLGTERLDLVDLRIASPVLRFEIIRTGYPLYVADELIRERFELSTLHLYRDTAHLRHRQLEHLKERISQWSSDEKPSKND